MTINEGGTLTINGNLSGTGGGNITVNNGGTLIIYGGLSLSAKMQINRGGKVTVENNVTVINSDNLVIGENSTAATPAIYADMIINGNLVSSNSGDIAVNKFGRLAVFGDLVSSNGGGSFLQLKNGAQVYIDGDISFTGGGDAIRNNENPNSPYGLYVNGSIQNTNGVTNPAQLKTFTINGVDITVPCYNSTCELPNNTTNNVGDKATMEALNPDFAAWLGAIPGSPLPVTLLDFKVSKVTQTSIELTWATASEYNNSHFEVLRSSDGKNWKEVGFVDGIGTNETNRSYSFIDNNPLHGISFYILRQVDFDGKRETFKPISANFSSERYQIDVYPNPTTDRLNLRCPVGTVIDSIIIYNLSGSLIREQKAVLAWMLPTFMVVYIS